MEGKLIKTGKSFILKDDKGETLGITGGTIPGRKLSLQNCQAIENGYDLDELAEQEVKLHNTLSPKAFKRGVQIGFQKALEILVDKKFSEEDLKNTCYQMWYQSDMFHNSENFEDWFNTHIQSLQQTEWDVEIEMEVVPDLDSRTEVDGQVFSTNKKEVVKLDADGNLILKRVV